MKMQRYANNIAFYILFLLMLPVTGIAQEEEIPREYSAEEYVSLNENLSMADALAILSAFATKYENKLILDDKEHRMPIGVTVDNMHWMRALQYILRSNRLAYEAHPRHYRITPEGGDIKEELDSDITFDTREIEIKAVFFEADYATLTELGVDWSTITDGKVKVRIDSRAGAQVTNNLFSIRATTQKLLDVTALLNAVQSWDKGQILANPQIRIMDGEEGKIKVGKNFYLTTRDFAGNTRYREYEAGTILTVIPVIYETNDQTFIHLDITAEKSDVDVTSLGVTKKITEGKTKVLLLDGEETALAGLFSDQRSMTRKGIPVLKDLPWWFLGLRYLTGYDSQTMSKKELIILIQANIIPNLASRQQTKDIKKYYLQRKRKEYHEKSRQLTRR